MTTYMSLMWWVCIPLWTQSCNVWVNGGQLQSQVWHSMHPASVLCFYDNKWREAFLTQVDGHKRKEKGHSLVRKHRVFTALLYPKVQQSVLSERCLQCFVTSCMAKYGLFLMRSISVFLTSSAMSRILLDTVSLESGTKFNSGISTFSHHSL